MLSLDYTNQTKHAMSEQPFEQLLARINEHFEHLFPKQLHKNDEHILAFTLVNDKTIRTLNNKHRGIDKATDVISLTYLEDETFPSDNLLGEIFISFETAEKQAKEMGRDTAHELYFLFVHGVLHVLGYDHQTEEDFETMMKITEEILDF